MSRDTDSPNEGTVYRKSTGTYFVDVNGETVICTISSKLRRELVYPLAMESKEAHMPDVPPGGLRADAVRQLARTAAAGRGGQAH